MNRAMLIVLAAAAIAISPPAAGAGEKCFSDWSVAAPMVKKEGLATVETLTALARAKLPGNIVKTVLCQDDGKYFYRVVVRDDDGRLRTVTVDARKPFDR